MQFDALELTETVHRGAGTIVSRGSAREGGDPVIFKALPAPMQTPAHIARLRYEWRILLQLRQAGNAHVPEPLGFVEIPGVVGLVLRDIGGKSLRALHREQSLSLHTILHIAHEVATALLQVHQCQVVHKDINPNNIIFNPRSNEVQLIDFDLASQVAREVQEVAHLSKLEGTLAYLSPEQTGRTHAALDYRSDFYSLGATLYELCTGSVPFDETEVSRLVHAILSRVPMHPSERAPRTPQVLGDLIGKLLRKDPEERYSSAFGLRADLARCLAALQEDGTIAPFALGADDRNTRFAIPQRLYGREGEVARVLEIYTRASRGANVLLMISGPSGIGKSALVNAVQGAMVAHHGLFGSGKYDQLSRHIPFSALSQAISVFVRSLLMEPQQVLDGWRRHLQEAVGNVGQALVNVVPAVEWLIGKQKPVPELAPKENENRLLLLFQRFLVALCKRQPLVLFLDDLQWADNGTLKLLRRLAAETHVGAGMLLIGAYRDNEAVPGGPLQTELHGLQQAGIAYETMRIEPLPLAAAIALVQDTTHTNGADAAPLAELLLTKTAGNPFLLQEFFNSLWQRELLRYDVGRGQWLWDMERLRTTTVTDNVAELLTHRMASLEPAAREALCVGACLGNVFSLQAMAAVQDQSPQAIAGHLQVALREGLLVPVAGAYRYASESQSDDVHYRFAHDRIQRAAYDSIPQEAMRALHHRIGRSMLQQGAPPSGDSWLFRVAEHLNAAPELLHDAAERLTLARLNLQAGQHACMAAAHGIATDYFRAGLSLLPEQAWQDHYDIMRGLTLGLAEAQFLSGQADAASEQLQLALSQSRSSSERVEVHKKRMRIFNAMQRFDAAIEAGIGALRELGHRASSHPTNTQLGVSFARLRWKLRGRSIRALAQAAPITDQGVADTVALWLSVAVPAYASNAKLFMMAVLETCRLMLQHGKARQASSFGGMVMINTMLGNYDQAQQWGYLVRETLESDPGAPSKSIGHLVLAAFLEHLEKTPTQVAERLTQVVQHSFEEGVPAQAGKAANVHLMFLSCVSVELCRDMAQNNKALATPGISPHDRAVGQVMLQYCRALRGETTSPVSFEDGEFSEERVLQDLDVHSHRGMLYYHKMVLAFLARDFDLALRCAAWVREHKVMRSVFDSMILWFNTFLALTLIQRALNHPLNRAETRLLRRAHARLQGAARAGPTIFGGFAVLIEAERLGLSGKHQAAATAYERAMDLLQNSGHPCFMAVGWECAGRFYVRAGLKAAAHHHLLMARDTYRAWGALHKERELAREFPQLADADVHISMHATQGSSKRSTSHSLLSLDLAALMDAAQALSGEIVLERLVQKILDIAQQSAGATRAVLLLWRDERLQVVADTQQPAGEVPLEMLHYTVRTSEPIALQDVAHEHRFRDAYLQRARPKAVLCVPIMHQGKIGGAMYLENNVATGTFGATRVTTVKFLATQAATALENANLYGHLEEEVAQRTAALQQTHARLVELEKGSVEMQMAGGFAHEMRNALSSARMPLDMTIPTSTLAAEHTYYEGMRLALDHLVERHDVPQALTELRVQQDAMKEALETVRSGIDRALSITGEILVYADVGRTPPGDHSSDIHSTLQPILDAYAARCAEAHIAVRADIPADVHASIREEHLHTVLQHLIDNAYDALCSADERQPRNLDIQLAASADSVTIDVRDSGTGMPDDVQSHLFQPFFSTKGAHGVGLGLPLCKKLVQVYRGDIAFTTMPGATAFKIRLPRQVLGKRASIA